MSKKRICVIKSRRYPPTHMDIIDGGTLNVYRIVEALKAKGFEIDVFTRLENEASKNLRSDAINIFHIPFNRSLKSRGMERDYEEGYSFVEGVLQSQFFDPEKYLCVHTHHWTSGIGLTSYLPPGCKLLHTPHLLALEKAYYNGISCPSEVEKSERELIDRTNTIFALSNTEAEALQYKYSVNLEKVVVAPNGVSRSFFAIPPVISLYKLGFSLLCIGRTCQQKGIDVLLDAVEYLLKLGLPVEVQLVGGSYWEPDYERVINERINLPEMQGKIHSIGQVSHDKIPEMLSKCCIYVQPSRYESQGIALLEAMAAGRVVVASDLPAVREYLSHGNNGLLFEPGNAEALAETLLFLYSNPTYAENLAAQARLSAHSFTWDRLLQRTLPIITGENLG